MGGNLHRLALAGTGASLEVLDEPGKQFGQQFVALIVIWCYGLNVASVQSIVLSSLLLLNLLLQPAVGDSGRCPWSINECVA